MTQPTAERVITQEDVLDHLRFLQRSRNVALIADWPRKGINNCPECGRINATLRALSNYMGGKPSDLD